MGWGGDGTEWNRMRGRSVVLEYSAAEGGFPSFTFLFLAVELKG